ncbi:MAG: sodium:calcium antiporter, partial [Chlorobiaceae bacterium]|nr:sodium:calcium antiporter [Chlorobiaceae bacterium]
MTIIYFILGLIALVVGADLLVKGASKLAAALGISALVIGLTVVAYGTSSPELAVSLQSSLEGKADLAVGNVVGSNIFNVLFILGVSALIIPLVISNQLIKIDVPIMIGATILLLLFSLNGKISKIEGIIFLSIAMLYTVFALRLGKNTLSEKEKIEAAEASTKEKRVKNIFIDVGYIIVGLAFLIIGSDLLVDSAVIFAKYFGVSEMIIGLTIVAVGTSLPEVATSIVAAIKGQRDIAVGNIIGSNIFNIVFILGVSSIVSISGLNVNVAMINFDIPFALAIAIACLPIFFRG